MSWPACCGSSRSRYAPSRKCTPHVHPAGVVLRQRATWPCRTRRPASRDPLPLSYLVACAPLATHSPTHPRPLCLMDWSPCCCPLPSLSLPRSRRLACLWPRARYWTPPPSPWTSWRYRGGAGHRGGFMSSGSDTPCPASGPTPPLRPRLVLAHTNQLALLPLHAVPPAVQHAVDGGSQPTPHALLSRLTHYPSRCRHPAPLPCPPRACSSSLSASWWR